MGMASEKVNGWRGASSSVPQVRRGWRAEELGLAAALIVLIVAVWLEPPGSYLAEPDEARYAEIPREMLATGDFLTPRINGVPYLEKPPLLYWMNAASMRLFGLTPWAARLPARLAGLGSAILLAVAVGRLAGRSAGLIAAALFLCSPLGFVLSRLNLTDGLLSFFFTAMLLGSLLLLRAPESRKSFRIFEALLGVAAAGSFMTKGLVGVFLAALILLLWSFATGRVRALGRLIAGPAAPLFIALTAPWFILMERQHPGFLRFFFIREHFQRFTTTMHGREEPPYFFLGVFLLGFLPALELLGSGLRRLGPLRKWPRAHPEALFFLLWGVVVVAFFSASQSQLIPYILPGIPAAAALTAFGAVREDRPARGAWVFHALAVAILVGVAATNPEVRQWVADYHLQAFALGACVSLLAGAILALLAPLRTIEGRVAAVSVGWAGFYIALAVAWPRTPPALDVHELARLAREEIRTGGAELVAYRTYLQGFPWELKTRVAVADPGGELGDALEMASKEEKAIDWSREEFWRKWRGEKPLLVLARERDLDDFDHAEPVPRFLARGRNHFLLSNVELAGGISGSGLTSAALFSRGSGEGAAPVPVSEIPRPALLRASRENGGHGFIWALQEKRNGQTLYELVTGGRSPRAVKVTARGEFVYLEEEVQLRDLPDPVRHGILRSYPLARHSAFMREFRRARPPPVVFEVHLSVDGVKGEAHFDAAGQKLTASDASGYD